MLENKNTRHRVYRVGKHEGSNEKNKLFITDCFCLDPDSHNNPETGETYVNFKKRTVVETYGTKK